MRYIDLHCDTLYRAVIEEKSLFYPDFAQRLDSENLFSKRLQCLAIWIPDSIAVDDARLLFDKACKKLSCELSGRAIAEVSADYNIAQENPISVMLTVENGLLIGNDAAYIDRLAESGVRILTLTWNSANSIGNGADITDNLGLTEFGKIVVDWLERKNIIIDVSHANDKTFYDVAEAAKKPFIATHSNSRSVTPHRRNLTDGQFKIIKDFGGIVGINFCRSFLNEKADDASVNDIIKHTEHFLSLGGEDCVAVGSDFDGCDTPVDLPDISCIPKLYEAFLRLNYSETLLDKIFFKNADDFFRKFFDI